MCGSYNFPQKHKGWVLAERVTASGRMNLKLLLMWSCGADVVFVSVQFDYMPTFAKSIVFELGGQIKL